MAAPGWSRSQQLVAMMEGQIGCRRTWHGSTFGLPLEKQAAGTEALERYSRDLFDLQVPVVDDNVTNHRILSHQLLAWNIQTASAAGGDEALKMLRAAAAAGKPYDLALLDVQMPEMDGFILASAIKAIRPSPGLG
jgi:PleD family two-component response regulator